MIIHIYLSKQPVKWGGGERDAIVNPKLHVPALDPNEWCKVAMTSSRLTP